MPSLILAFLTVSAVLIAQVSQGLLEEMCELPYQDVKMRDSLRILL